jgi:phosphotransacetylase
MKPVFAQARRDPKRVIYAAGEDERVLRAAQVVLDEGIARPILIGRPRIVRRRAERLGLRFQPGSRRRAGRSVKRPALRQVLARLSRADGAAAASPPDGAQPGALQPHAHRGPGGEAAAMPTP